MPGEAYCGSLLVGGAPLDVDPSQGPVARPRDALFEFDGSGRARDVERAGDVIPVFRDEMIQRRFEPPGAGYLVVTEDRVVARGADRDIAVQ